MIIVYLAAICPTEMFKKLEGDISVAAYKYNKLLAEGIALQKDISLKAVVPFSIVSRLANVIPATELVEENVEYIISPVCNSHKEYIIWLIRYISKLKNEDKVVVVCDALSLSADITCIILNRLYDIDNVGIITDLPKYVGDNRTLKKKVYSQLTTHLMRKLRKYILLTVQMTDVINKHRKPQCIIEGICDCTKPNNTLQGEKKKKVCMYAGSLHREYGIDMLIKAFIDANLSEYELHVYGKGNYEKEIRDICQRNSKIVFKGQRPLDEVLYAEKNATLLINPRPTNMDYTKYSFPSKNIEYMASGTPLLTTNLPGMPVEYKKYVYIFDEENQMAYTKKIVEVLSQSIEELDNFGRVAQEFVISTRNKDMQARKVIDII